MHGVRQTHPVRGRAEAHVLLHTPTVPLTRGDREPAEQGTRIADAAGGVTDQAWANADYPRDHGGSEKGGEGWYGSRQIPRWRLPYQAPLIPAKDGQSPSPRRAEPAFHRARDATCRLFTR